MKVLLWQDVDKLGRRGETVDVREGFARNFLFPRKLASIPTPSMHKEFTLAKRRVVKQEAALIGDANLVAEKLAGVTSVSIEVNTNEEGLLYGAVSPSMVADALKDQGLKIEARAIEIAEPIKKVGTYEVVVNLHREVKPKLKVWVLSTKAVKPEGAAKGDDKKDASKS
ncbi:MAG TPA: 50S ribosomal protein L9 [Planctomycetota bacterium]|jgi:large subunit ribosomal protein L9|nr:50S ribosomal protein L9 [Planctomycetota bacterium]